MASVISAVIDKFNGLTAANFASSSRPPIYLDDAPAKDGSGNDLRPPYTILKDNGLSPDPVFEYPVVETGSFTLTVYYGGTTPLAHCDLAAEAIKYNGGTLATAGGFDFGTLTLPSGYALLVLKRTGERRFFTGGIDRTGQRVHAVELTYTHEVQRT